MNRLFGLAILVAAGMLLGFAMGSLPGIHAAPPSARDANDPMIELVSQLKEVNAQVKEINALLHDGNVKTVVIMNPDASR